MWLNDRQESIRRAAVRGSRLGSEAAGGGSDPCSFSPECGGEETSARRPPLLTSHYGEFSGPCTSIRGLEVVERPEHTLAPAQALKAPGSEGKEGKSVRAARWGKTPSLPPRCPPVPVPTWGTPRTLPRPSTGRHSYSSLHSPVRGH